MFAAEYTKGRIDRQTIFFDTLSELYKHLKEKKIKRFRVIVKRKV